MADRIAKLYPYLISFLTMALAACGGARDAARITAFTDPSYTGVSFNDVAIQFATRDLIARERGESRIAEELRERGARATESFRLLTPTRDWSAESRDLALRDSGVTALVMVTEVDAWRGVQHLPGKVTTTTTLKEQPAKDSSRSANETMTTTTASTAPRAVITDWVKYEIRVIDVRTGATAWIGMDWVSAGLPALGEFCERLASRLASDRIVAAR